MKKTSLYVIIPTILTSFFAFCSVSFATDYEIIPTITNTSTGAFTQQSDVLNCGTGGFDLYVYGSLYPSTDTLIMSGNGYPIACLLLQTYYSPASSYLGATGGWYKIIRGGDTYFMRLKKEGGIWQHDSGIPPNTTTRIISVMPENNETIVPFTQSSTTKYAPFDIDLLEYYNNTSTSTISYITTTLINKNIPAFTYTSTLLDIATGTATTSYSIYDKVPFGLYDYTIRLFDSNLDIIDSTTTTNIQFGSTTLPSTTFEDIYGATSTDVYTATQKSIYSYLNFITLLKTKVPFGYFYVIKDALSGINTTSTSTFNIIIPAHLKIYFFNPFDLAFSGILWFYFITFFYKRIKHIDI